MAIEIKGNIIYNKPYIAPQPVEYTCVNANWDGYKYGWPPGSLGEIGWQYNSGECFADPSVYGVAPPSLQMGGAGSYVITPIVENIQYISFWARSNWNARYLEVYGSEDGGTNWELIARLSNNMDAVVNNLDTSGSSYNRIKFLNVDSIAMQLDDITITCLGII